MSGRKRFFVDGIDYPAVTEVELTGEEFIHAKTVQRVEEGSEIILLDGSGREYSAIVAVVSKKSLTAHITGAIESDREPKTPIYLLCGALKGDKTELVVQKACELGVGKIGIFNSKYCSAFMNDNKIERLNKVSREATKQCMRSVAPEVEYFDSFEKAIISAKDYENKFFACEFATGSQRDISGAKGSCALVVGSEGGFAEEEAELAEKYGFALISLGKRILRAETAAIAVMTLCAYFLGELK